MRLSASYLRLNAICALLILGVTSYAESGVDADKAVKVIIAEACNQGAEGMQAVGEVIRRRGSLKPFCAARRPDLDAFVERQGKQVLAMAKEAWKRSEHSDITCGSTNYENVKAFGKPRWAKEMIETITIKDHTFYREAL